MSLNWKLPGLAERGLRTPTQWPLTNELIWLTMGIGLSKLTEKNIDTWVFRLRIWFELHALGGPPNRRDLIKRIGLSTNADDLTDAAFKKKVMDIWWRRISERAKSNDPD